ncbi:MAG: phosphoribosylaminoimidazolesuccinocarboxamide synthase [Dehalococcoidia bacterium]|nr:phosphoribosylaminoimidazolesuccinocarboxamide synthase [Dehalococcoidia bacterium]
MMPVLLETALPNMFRRGKVRDTYDLGEHLLMVATDRISAFDVVLPTGIPDKGAVLTQLSAYWFEHNGHIIKNHLVETILEPAQLEPYRDRLGGDPGALVGRSMLVRRAEPVLVECVVRGYLAGSGWAEYRRYGTLAGESLPGGMRESEELPEPRFTPSTKAESGHDENISIREMENLVGAELTAKLRRSSIAVYEHARNLARARGIIIADTKFEFGLVDGEVILIDEALTPDSSRFWGTVNYRPGIAPPSFDKQYVRDWLVESGWDKEPPAPELPAEVVAKTTQMYREAYERITGHTLHSTID